MRSVVIAVNLLQMFIIVALFLTHGIGLGGWTIWALFILMVAAFFNLLVLLFKSGLAGTNRPGHSTAKGGLVKRQDLRVRYPSSAQAQLIVKNSCYAVLDLSENGMRIGIRRQEPLKRRFNGKITLLSGQTLPVRIIQVRRQGDEAALLIKQPLDWNVLIIEKELASNQVDRPEG